jgi:hypothetical protein
MLSLWPQAAIFYCTQPPRTGRRAISRKITVVTIKTGIARDVVYSQKYFRIIISKAIESYAIARRYDMNIATRVGRIDESSAKPVI